MLPLKVIHYLTPALSHPLYVISYETPRKSQNTTGYCCYPWCLPEVEYKSLSLKTPALQIQNLEDMSCIWPKSILHVGELLWCQKVPCKFPREGSNQQLYSAMMPVNYSNYHFTIKPKGAMVAPTSFSLIEGKTCLTRGKLSLVQKTQPSTWG